MNSPDLNNDGKVDSADLSVLFANFGKTVEPIPAPIAPHHTIQQAPSFHHYVGVSMAFAVTPDNPRGWNPTYRQAFETAGYFALAGEVQQAVSDGKDAIWLWEPTGQTTQDAENMAFTSQAAFEDGSTKAMRETFQDFVAMCNWHGLHVGVYCGNVNKPNFGSTLRPDRKDANPSHIDWLVRQCSFWARMGVTMWGMDALSWGLAKDPVMWERFILKLRQDVECEDMLLVSELWLPGGSAADASSALTNARRQFFLSQLYPLLLCRTGDKTEDDAPLKDEYWNLVRHAEERALVPAYRGCVMLHGSKWTQAQRVKARERAALLGLDLMTHYTRGEIF